MKKNKSAKIQIDLFARCMSFPYTFKTLRNGNTYDSSAQLEMSTDEEKVKGEVEIDANEGNGENSVRFSPNMLDERINVNL